jgi:hypothetical protein
VRGFLAITKKIDIALLPALLFPAKLFVVISLPHDKKQGTRERGNEGTGIREQGSALVSCFGVGEAGGQLKLFLLRGETALPGFDLIEHFWRGCRSQNVFSKSVTFPEMLV